jgi:orotidine-5'-phosphate decarboxylase
LDSKPVIVALDFPDAAKAWDAAHRLDPQEARVKVGKELFVAAGPAFVERLQGRGFEVFLDLKFHDIPSTVAGACRAAANLGVWMCNVHASGGEAMLAAAREAIDAAARKPLLVAVTVLTSLDEAALHEIGFSGSLAERVESLAGLARRCGLDGVVCSAEEASRLRALAPAPFALVTPGIRLERASRDDQARVVTPVEAVRLGADYLVIGRPITRAADPARTLSEILHMLRQSVTPTT